MLRRLKQMWTAAPIATALLVLSLLVAGGFSVRLAANLLRPPPPTEVVIEAWMTPRLIAHTYRVPPEVMRVILDIEKVKGHPMNLAQIAAERGQDVDTLIADLEQSIKDIRSAEKAKK